MRTSDSVNLKGLRLLAIIQCCLLAGSLGLAACNGDDDDAAASNTSCEEDHDEESEEAAAADAAVADGGEAEHDAEHDEEAVGTMSGATCPDADKPTYDNFGKKFMTDYCVRCHSSENKTCDERMDAPTGHDFDTLPGILGVANHIDQKAAFGPDSMNDEMPPNGKTPTDAEREKLGEWLACEQAELDNQ